MSEVTPCVRASVCASRGAHNHCARRAVRTEELSRRVSLLRAGTTKPISFEQADSTSGLGVFVRSMP